MWVLTTDRGRGQGGFTDRLLKQVKAEPEEQFFDQRIKALRPIDHRYPHEVHLKAEIGSFSLLLTASTSWTSTLDSWAMLASLRLRSSEGSGTYFTCEEQEERRQNVQNFRLTQHEKMCPGHA